MMMMMVGIILSLEIEMSMSDGESERWRRWAIWQISCISVVDCENMCVAGDINRTLSGYQCKLFSMTHMQ